MNLKDKKNILANFEWFYFTALLKKEKKNLHETKVCSGVNQRLLERTLRIINDLSGQSRNLILGGLFRRLKLPQLERVKSWISSPGLFYTVEACHLFKWIPRCMYSWGCTSTTLSPWMVISLWCSLEIHHQSGPQVTRFLCSGSAIRLHRTAI